MIEFIQFCPWTFRPEWVNALYWLTDVTVHWISDQMSPRDEYLPRNQSPCLQHAGLHTRRVGDGGHVLGKLFTECWPNKLLCTNDDDLRLSLSYEYVLQLKF